MNRHLLIGKAPPEFVQARLRKVLDDDPVVERLQTFKAVIFGSDSVRLSVEVEFHGEELARRHLTSYDLPEIWQGLSGPEELEELLIRFGDGLIEALGDEVDRLEQKLREADPDARQVDLEVN
jgi:zinc transporter 9